jgi:ABC-type bacteriocin/lantibiotic exporter with double-glycine peptidase domain
MGQTLSSADIFTILSLFNIIRGPLTAIVLQIIGKLSENMVSSQRINQFMNLSRQIRTKTLGEYSSSENNRIAGSIVMERASFTWDSTDSTNLIEINLNVNSGSLVGIIGSVGSCKSSLLAAILGEMSLIEGISKIYGKIAYVPQTP